MCVFALFLVPTALADNLFFNTTTGKIQYNELLGVVTNPILVCRDVYVEEAVCTAQPDLLVEQPDLCEDITTYVEQEVCEPVSFDYITQECTTFKGGKISCAEITRTSTMEYCSTELVPQTNNVCTPQEPLLVTQAPVCVAQQVLRNTCSTEYQTTTQATRKDVVVAHSLNTGQFVVEFENALMAENLYTQSKTVDKNKLYMADYIINKDKYFNKSTHPNKKTLIAKNGTVIADVLDSEDRTVTCEGMWAEQMLINSCVLAGNKYEKCLLDVVTGTTKK